ncbi:MAG: isoprenylcysteine carboxylmethyltransferase family protein [Bacteroidales bacterium]|nr:isoprenylcysteine carboxylmethyltransferase family protein [Bacteroidales bacterium]
MTEIVAVILMVLFWLMIAQMAGFAIYLRINKLSVGGVAPVHPFLFKLAKLAMFACWFALFMQSAGLYSLLSFEQSLMFQFVSLVLFLIGFTVQAIAYINLGLNLKFGIPDEAETNNTTLQVNGLYRFSRNPMYLGFFLMTIAACFYVPNPVVWALALFTIGVHHWIVLREEEFLKRAFGNAWVDYTLRVRRYV